MEIMDPLDRLEFRAEGILNFIGYGDGTEKSVEKCRGNCHEGALTQVELVQESASANSSSCGGFEPSTQTALMWNVQISYDVK